MPIKTLKKIYKKIRSGSKEIRFPVSIVQRTGKKNIIFVLPKTSKPAGGIIVAHNHSDKINTLNDPQVSSSVFYPEDCQFNPDIFVHQSIFKRDFAFDPQNDLVLLPEMMTLRYAGKLFEAGIPYGIHVQNGYSMDLELRMGLGNFEQLKKAYTQASLLIGNSIDTIANIEFVFPECKNKIVPLYYVIDKARYQPLENKKNIITYMPRKLEAHTKMALFFLGDKLPKHWEIKAIDGVPEQTVYDIFYESKIFLSFSEFEGIAMPPAMAAMSGNRVIGYTGEANKEYFHLPCFEEVQNGDIKLFVKKILDAVNRFDQGLEKLDLDSIYHLQNMFSKQKQEAQLKTLIEKTNQLLK